MPTIKASDLPPELADKLKYHNATIAESHTVTLPWPPSVNRYWRAVNGRNILSAEGRAYRASLRPSDKIVRGRLAVTIYAYPPDKRRRDLDNMLKAVLDGLTHTGAIEDDGNIDDLHIVRGDTGNLQPHVLVDIKALETITPEARR